MYHCKLCDAPVLKCKNRRRLASTTSQQRRALLIALAIETDSAKEYESGYLCKRCYDSVGKYLSLQEALEDLKKDLKSKISSRHVQYSCREAVPSEKRGTKRVSDIDVSQGEQAVKVSLNGHAN